MSSRQGIAPEDRSAPSPMMRVSYTHTHTCSRLTIHQRPLIESQPTDRIYTTMQKKRFHRPVITATENKVRCLSHKMLPNAECFLFLLKHTVHCECDSWSCQYVCMYSRLVGGEWGGGGGVSWLTGVVFHTQHLTPGAFSCSASLLPQSCAVELIPVPGEKV